MKTIHSLATVSCGLALSASAMDAGPDRTILPIEEPLRETTDVLDVRKATPPPRFEVKAPEGSPNVLLDDLGFAGTSAFGGPVATPIFDRIAAGGLKYNNFHTTAFGKWSETAAWEASVAGTHQVEIPEDKDYHFLTDMTNQTISWLGYQKALTPEKPFFIYYAPGAVHAPHHLPADWIANWKGKLDGGWDAMREQIPARQIELGVIPQGTRLDPNLLNR